MEFNINYLAVILAAVLSMVIGFVWYGVLFKDQWMRLMGYTAESMQQMKMSASTAYVIQFISSIVMAFFLAHILIASSLYTQVVGISAGVVVGVFAWAGFVLPVTLGWVLWEDKSWKLWLINSGSYLVTLIVMGVTLALWR